jgi:hypothetical protein
MANGRGEERFGTRVKDVWTVCDVCHGSSTDAHGRIAMEDVLCLVSCVVLGGYAWDVVAHKSLGREEQDGQPSSKRRWTNDTSDSPMGLTFGANPPVHGPVGCNHRRPFITLSSPRSLTALESPALAAIYISPCIFSRSAEWSILEARFTGVEMPNGITLSLQRVLRIEIGISSRRDRDREALWACRRERGGQKLDRTSSVHRLPS